MSKAWMLTALKYFMNVFPTISVEIFLDVLSHTHPEYCGIQGYLQWRYQEANGDSKGDK